MLRRKTAHEEHRQEERPRGGGGGSGCTSRPVSLPSAGQSMKALRGFMTKSIWNRMKLSFKFLSSNPKTRSREQVVHPGADSRKHRLGGGGEVYREGKKANTRCIYKSVTTGGN